MLTRYLYYSIWVCVMGVVLGGSALLAQESETERQYPLLPNRYAAGYLLTKQGDTIPGYIRPGNLFKDQGRIFFMDYHGGRTTYRADRIGGFGYEDRDYVSLYTPFHFAGILADSNLFMLRLVQGPADLYRFYTRRSPFTLQKGPAYFDLLVKPDGSQHEISYAFKWERLALALQDHPTLPEAIRRGQYRPEDTQQIIETYNQWYLQQHAQQSSLYE